MTNEELIQRLMVDEMGNPIDMGPSLPPNYGNKYGQLDIFGGVKRQNRYSPRNRKAFQATPDPNQISIFDGAMSNAMVPVGDVRTLKENMGTPLETGLVHLPNAGGQYSKESFWKTKPPIGDASSGVGGIGAKIKNGLGGASQKIAGAYDKLAGTAKTAWGNVKAGNGIMPKYAGLAKAGMGIGAGISALKGFNEYQNAKADADSLVDDILQSAAGNEMLRYDLSSDQLDLLRKLRNGTYDLTGDFEAGDLLGNLGNIATGAGLGFVTGGGPIGAILGGASGVIDSVSSSKIGNQEKITQDLQNLYDALYESEMRNKSMQRDAAYQRYANSLY